MTTEQLSREAYTGGFVKAGRPQIGASLAVREEVLANYLVSLFGLKVHEVVVAKALGTSSFQNCVHQSRQTIFFFKNKLPVYES